MNKRSLSEEYIGAKIEVVDASDRGLVDIRGKVIDETKNTFTIENHKVRIVPKKGCLFKIALNDKWESIKGEDITYRPEDRIKKLG